MCTLLALRSLSPPLAGLKGSSNYDSINDESVEYISHHYMGDVFVPGSSDASDASDVSTVSGFTWHGILRVRPRGAPFGVGRCTRPVIDAAADRCRKSCVGPLRRVVRRAL